MDGEQKRLIEAARKFESARMDEEWGTCVEYLYRDGAEGAYKEVRHYRRIISKDLRNAMKQDAASALLKRAYILTARDMFEDYMIAMEWNRPQSEQFYLPRKAGLSEMVHALQRLADDELDVLGISMPPGVGKSGTAHFFLTWLMGKNPLEAILEGSHSLSLVRGVYSEILRMIDPRGDYLWHEIFPERRLAKTDAQDLQIAIDKAQKYPSISFTATGAANAGRLRAIQLLYCDDLISGIEEALSRERLDTKFRAYSDDLGQRMQGECKELHIATRWSVYDVIGRLKEHYANNSRALFINLPAMNEKGESNFDYGGKNGFSTAFYDERRAIMDEISFNSIYMGKPIEREGLLYEADTMRWYIELPPGAPDGVFAVCDTATGKGDDTVLLVFAVYGNDHYLIDCECSSDLPEVLDERLASCLTRNKVQMCRFESNAAGGRTADDVGKLVKERGWDMGITKEWTQQNKETKIIANSAWVKSRCLFRSLENEPKNSVYAQTMRKAMTYSHIGKNKHDDVPDALAQYALFMERPAESATPSVMVYDRKKFGF